MPGLYVNAVTSPVKAFTNISSYNLIEHECHDYRGFDHSCLDTDFDDSEWQNAEEVDGPNTEYYFTDVLWPDFKPKHLFKAIEEYNNRDRRYGGRNEDDE